MFNRNIYSKISRFLENPEAIAITGPRRVGKTTTLKHFYGKIKSENKIFLDIEDPLNRAIFDTANYSEIKQSLEGRGIDFEAKNYIFLDEIQFQKNLPSIIKYFYDHLNTKFFVTGSSSFYLKNLFTESLAGRKFLFDMYPLSFSEFLKFKGLKYSLPEIGQKVSRASYLELQPLYEEFMLYGGFPQVVLAKTIEEKNEQLRDIFSAYFQKEILQLSDFKKDEEIRKLILLLTDRVGQKLDIQRLSSEMGIARQTIGNFLEYLKGTYLIDLIPPFGRYDISTRKQSKVYFIDTGILNFLGKKELGNIFENSTYLNVKTQEDIINKANYYEKGNKEIDFIINDVAYEVKLFATEKDLKRVIARSEKLKIERQYIFSYKYSEVPNVIYGFQEL